MRHRTGNNFLDRRVVKNHRARRIPDRIEGYSHAVRSREIRDRLSVCIVRRRCARCAVPAAEGKARSRVLIRRKRVGISASEVRIRHAAHGMRRAGIIAHRIALLAIDCVHREVTAQRLIKVVGRAVRLCPVVKDIIRLVVRTRGFGRRAAVHRVRVLHDDLVLMARIRIRRIQHRDRVVAHGPVCAEHQVSGHWGRKVCRASVRILPAAKVKAGTGARRGAADCRRCNDRVTVDNDLRCRGHASAVCVKAHGIARQEVVIRKRGLRCSAVSDRCREGTSRHLFLNCHTAVHHRSGLRDVIGNAIHSTVIGIASLRRRRSSRCGRSARKLAELIDIVACEEEAQGTDRKGTRTRAVHREGLRAVCRCRHGQGAHAGNRRTDCLKLEVEGLSY